MRGDRRAPLLLSSVQPLGDGSPVAWKQTPEQTRFSQRTVHVLGVTSPFACSHTRLELLPTREIRAVIEKGTLMRPSRKNARGH